MLYLISVIISFVLLIVMTIMLDKNYKDYSPNDCSILSINPMWIIMLLTISSIPLINILISILCIYAIRKLYIESNKFLCLKIMNKLLGDENSGFYPE